MRQTDYEEDLKQMGESGGPFVDTKKLGKHDSLMFQIEPEDGNQQQTGKFVA